MINFLLFVRLCCFETREDGLEILEKHKGWAMALGFNNGAPHVRIKTRTWAKFTSYSRGKKRASIHWAGMTLILDAIFGLGIINLLEKTHIQFVCRGKQRTKVAEREKEIPVEEYFEVVLTSPKEYPPTTERGKKAKAKRDALKEPVKIEERMVDVTNCEKRVRAIAVKEKGKKSMDIWLTNISASLQSPKGIIEDYRNRKHK